MSLELVLPRIAAHIEDIYGLKPQSVNNYAWLKAVSQRIEETDSIDVNRYLDYLLKFAAEGQQLVELLVVSETWFFRDPIALDFLVTHIRVAEMMGRRKPWRILSLGCASGEEAYSIAMVLLDAGLTASRFSIEGVDVSSLAITKAQQGVYGANSFRSQTTLLHKKHFHKLGENRFSIDYNIRSRVSFQHANFLAPHFALGRAHYDVIFCRNVLIYFKRKTQGTTLRLCRDLLEKDGILIVGPTESEMARQAGFEPMGMRLSCAFRCKWLEAVTPFKKLAFQVPPKPAVVVPEEPALVQAMRLADEGDIEGSLSICQRHLDVNGPAPEVLYLMGTLSLASRHLTQAEEYFTRAIYLLPDHYQSLVNLALLAEGRGDKKSAELFWTRAKKHAAL